MIQVDKKTDPDQEFLQIMVGIQYIIANPIRDQGGKCSVTCSIGTAPGYTRSNQALYSVYTRCSPAWKRVKGG